MSGKDSPRIYLSPPHLSGTEGDFLRQALDSNWIAPLGPQVDAFEREFADYLGTVSAAALSSGTAALHLALRLAGVQAGDEVFCSTLTFVASANPILYLGATPVFVDADPASWNLDPSLLQEELEVRQRKGKLPRAVIVADVFGQSADYDRIEGMCTSYGVQLVEDAAESLGATYRDRKTGRFGKCGAFSFNGNKIMTTSGGGMLVSEDDTLIRKARFLASQARDEGHHYEHSQLGYNYRMSNLLAAVGRAQLQVLEERVVKRRAIFDFYHAHLSDLPGIRFMPEAEYGRATRWLTCMEVSPETFGADREAIRLALEMENIESRPVWKPLHCQPLFAQCQVVGGRVAEGIFSRGLCLPSGSSLTRAQQSRIVEVVRKTCTAVG